MWPQQIRSCRSFAGERGGGRAVDKGRYDHLVDTPRQTGADVDHEGEVLDMLVKRRRNSRSALRLMLKLLKKQGFVPNFAGHRQAALLRLRVPTSATDLSP